MESQVKRVMEYERTRVPGEGGKKKILKDAN